MRKTILILALALSGCTCINKLYNDFNYIKKVKEIAAKEDIIRIYFDRWGDIYPQHFINHETFSSNMSVLEKVYLSDGGALQAAFTSENLKTAGTNPKDEIRRLEEELARKYAGLISGKSKGKKLVFLIHGYNNTAEESSANYEKARYEITQKLQTSNIQFVEIYWDGLTDNGSAINSTRIWDNAQVSAAFVGLGLRRVLSKLDSRDVYVLTHSHGAGVITEALFNVRRFKPKYYTDDDAGKEIVNLQNDARYITPTAVYHVAMLAPAIPGENVFFEYHRRTTANGNTEVKLNNYFFIDGFNENDAVTTKWKFSSKFGATTLACKRSELGLVQDIFKGHPENFKVVDFSASNQKEHGFDYYMQNPKFGECLDVLFGD